METPSTSFEVIVVDTGHPDASTAQIAGVQGARYLRLADVGVAAARNRGAASAAGDFLLFVDDDIIVGRDNLERHAEVHRHRARCLVSGHWEYDRQFRARLEGTPLGRYRLRFEDEYNTPHGVSDPSRSGQVHPLTLAAANLSVSRNLFTSLGGFDERFPVGAEDQDLTWRARRAGWTLVYDYGIRVIHNDQHPDFRALCDRQERAAIGTVYFSRKHPDAPRAPMLDLNAPLRRQDPPRLVARKLSRSVLSSALPLAALQRALSVVVRLRRNGGWPLEVLYNGIGGLYVFRGVRRGIRMTAANGWKAAHRGS
jgi:GT2 family glycosyltransferase